MKKIVFLVLAFLISVSFLWHSPSVAEAASPISFVKVNGKRVSFPDGGPLIQNGRTLVPVRFIAEALGYEVEWHQPTKTVIIDGGYIELPIGGDTAIVNSENVPVEVPAILITTNNSTRTYVPLRFISENLNCTVDWFSQNRSIVVNTLPDTGREIDFYDRCKQSELFYEKLSKSTDRDPYWYSALYLKSSLQELTDEATYDANWSIERMFNGTNRPGEGVRDEGQNIRITMITPSLQSRSEIKQLLETFYPSGHAQVYDTLKGVVLEQVFEMFSQASPYYGIACLSGTSGTRYVDNREVVILKYRSTNYISILINDIDYINPIVPDRLSPEVLQQWIDGGISKNTTVLKDWYFSTYHLDQW